MDAIYFDLDGTLTDPKIGITRSIQYALDDLKLTGGLREVIQSARRLIAA